MPGKEIERERAQNEINGEEFGACGKSLKVASWRL